MEKLLPPDIALILFAISFSICGALILLHPFLARHLRGRDDLKSVQAAHQRCTPRIGGVGVLIAAVVALLFLVPDHRQLSFSVFALTLLPVFTAGLAEDLGWRVSALGRLLAAASSAGLAIVLLQVWIPPFGVAWLDLVMGFAPFAILVTILWATGVCHALNLIDGVNGLAGGTGLLIAVGIALVATQAGATGFATIAAALVPALIGFLVFNWPLGRIFLGDAGAYTLGHVLVWLAIGLAWVNPEVSALALSLMFFWPVADTFLAIARRVRAGRPVGAPDRLHFHQFVMRALMLLSGGRLSKGAANSATTLVLLPMIAAPVVVGVYLWDRPQAAVVAWVVFGLLFTMTYLIGVRLFRGNIWRRLARRLKHDTQLRRVAAEI